MTDSFVFYRSFDEACAELTDEQYGKIMRIINNYALNGTIPDNLSGIEKIIFTLIKPQIDANNQRKTNGCKGGAPSNNNAKKTTNGYTEKQPMVITEETNGYTEKQPMVITEETNGYAEKQPNVNVNVNANENVNERESHNANEVVLNTLTLSPPQTEYSKKIFEIFKKARLPCARENEISFLQTDFKNALAVIHRKEELQNVHSDDIIQACRNFTDIYSNPDTYCGFRQKIGFYQLVQKQWFYDLLPANFDKSRFLVRTADTQEDTRRTPEQIETQLLEEMQDDPRFIPKIFEHYHDEWIERGMPTGARYFDFQKEKCLSGYGQKLKLDFESEMGGSHGEQESN
ncbi:DUF6291 domain-containing protein [uncultured Treponema sp.]|uniref:DUF6291 domain-containing protein n=1 Tax=uncultured Treponema sp. TaxID=162155 RepID=UPI002592667D|nr:DUF6291 domain-containing protein [uncultured Treponema sp.]